MNDDINSDLQDTRVPTLVDLRARLLPPAGRETDVVVEMNGHRVWKRRADLAPGEQFIAFFGGDYSTVLEADDPKVQVPVFVQKKVKWPST